MITIRTETTGEYEFMDRLCRNMVNVKVYQPGEFCTILPGFPYSTPKQSQEQEEIPKKKPKNKRNIKKRFYFLLPAIIIAALLFLIGMILFVIHLWPESLFTSYYWRGFI